MSVSDLVLTVDQVLRRFIHTCSPKDLCVRGKFILESQATQVTVVAGRWHPVEIAADSSLRRSEVAALLILRDISLLVMEVRIRDSVGGEVLKGLLRIY